MVLSSVVLRTGYEALYQARGLSEPDGRPLYRYRFTRHEFDQVRQTLSDHRAEYGPELTLSNRFGAALFVAFTAEWYRREKSGGAWDWIRPLEAIGIRYHSADARADVGYSLVREAALCGLECWRRPRPRGSLLLTVIGEAGFPAAASREGRLGRWLRRSILAIESGFPADEAVDLEAWRAGETLVAALYDSAVVLCAKVAELRRVLTTQERELQLDPVHRLDTIRPGWRKELPFDLEEQDFRALVDDLIRVRGIESDALAATRILRREGRNWRARVSISLMGRVIPSRMPPRLQALCRESNRLRLFARGAIEDFGRPIAVVERFEEESETSWEVRPLVAALDSPLPLGEAVKLAAAMGSSSVTEFVTFAGDPLNGSVVALKPLAGEEPETAVELEVLGSSSVRSTHSWLALAARDKAFEAVQFEQSPIELGRCDDRRILAFRGRALLNSPSGRFVWQSGAEREENRRLVLIGDTLRSVLETVWRGTPIILVSDGVSSSRVRSNELYWRPIGLRKWQLVRDGAPLGRVGLATFDGGEISAWCQADIVPAGFALKADQKSRTLMVQGTAGASVAGRSDKPLPVRRQGNAVELDLSAHPPGRMLNLAVRWESQIDLTLPDPVAEPCLLMPDRSLAAPHVRISVGRLEGFRLLAPEPQKLLFEAKLIGDRPLFVVRDVTGLVPLSAFADDIRDMLGSTSDLDTEVRLTWTGRGDWLAEVAWYDRVRRKSRGVFESPFAALTKLSDYRLSAFSLSDPSCGACEDLPEMPDRELQHTLTRRLGRGPWLICGRSSDGSVLRPEVLVEQPEPGAPASSMQAAISAPYRSSRDEAFDAALQEPGSLNTRDLRHLVRLLVAADELGVPLSAIDAARAVARAPRSAVWILANVEGLTEMKAVLRLQSHLPFLWFTSSLSDWCESFARRLESKSVRLMELELPPADAHRSVARTLAQIVDLEPGLATHARLVSLIVCDQCSVAGDRTVRFLPPPAIDTRDQVASLVYRQTEFREPPTGLRLAELVPDEADWLARFDNSFRDVLAGPLVAARIATGALPIDPAVIGRCRVTWFYDREYFETSLAISIQALAVAPTDQ